MTATTTAPMRTPTAHPTLLVAGVVLAALLAVASIASSLPYLTEAPLAVTVTGFVLSTVTLVSAVPAARGRRWAFWTVLVATALAGISTAPLFIVPDAPAELVVGGAVAVAITAVDLVLLAVGGRRTR